MLWSDSLCAYSMLFTDDDGERRWGFIGAKEREEEEKVEKEEAVVEVEEEVAGGWLNELIELTGSHCESTTAREQCTSPLFINL